MKSHDLMVEEASLRAWPAIEQEVLDGWLLRFADGFTKRANSVQPFSRSEGDLNHKIALCEEWYGKRGQRCIFRITPFSDPLLEARLLERGYREIDRTIVMRRAVGQDQQVQHGAELVAVDLDEWLSLYQGMSGISAQSPPAFKRILEKGQDSRLLGVLRLPDGGVPVACGMAARDGVFVGLFDLVTAEQYRRTGFGTQLVGSMLQWAAGKGAEEAYLQVVSTNSSARRLYTKLGFQPVYEYFYLVQRDGAA